MKDFIPQNKSLIQFILKNILRAFLFPFFVLWQQQRKAFKSSKLILKETNEYTRISLAASFLFIALYRRVYRSSPCEPGSSVLGGWHKPIDIPQPAEVNERCLRQNKKTRTTATRKRIQRWKRLTKMLLDINYKYFRLHFCLFF